MRTFLLLVVALAIIVGVVLWRVAASGNLYGLSGIEVPTDKKDYVGAWNAPGHVLSIAQSGKIHYERHETNGGVTHDVTLDVPIQKFQGDDFVAGALFWTTTFHVTQPPHQEDKTWRMTSDGIAYSHP